MLQLISWQNNRMAAQTSSRWSTANQCISTTGSSQVISVRQKACCVTAIPLSGSRVPSIQWCCATDFRDIFS